MSSPIDMSINPYTLYEFQCNKVMSSKERHADSSIYIIRISMKQGDESKGKTCRFIHILYANFNETR